MSISNYIKGVKSDIKHWYLFPILGVLFILFGFWVLMTPLESYLSLVIIFSVSLFVWGILEIIFSIQNKNIMLNWGWFLFGGIFDVLLGILLITNPGLSVLVLALYVGFTLLYKSILGISFAVDLKGMGSKNWGWLLVLAILGVIASFVLMWKPVVAGFITVALTSFALMVLGIFYIILGLDLKKLKEAISPQ